MATTLPTPQGRPGGTHGGFASNGLTNTRLGDLVEAALAAELGWQTLHPGQRQGPLDFQVDLDGTAYGVEVKSVSIGAAEFKAKMKAHERAEKLAECERLGLAPMTVIAVVDDHGGAAVFGAEGITCARLSPHSETSWRLLGTVQVEL
jgi:hypothetical protein